MKTAEELFRENASMLGSSASRRAVQSAVENALEHNRAMLAEQEAVVAALQERRTIQAGMAAAGQWIGDSSCAEALAEATNRLDVLRLQVAGLKMIQNKIDTTKGV